MSGRQSGGWGRYLARRTVRLLISLAVVLTLTFLLIQLVPGDPIRAAMGPDAPQSLVRLREHQLYLDRPVIVQYLYYWKDVFTGHLGSSISTSQPVSAIVTSGLKNTATLVVIVIVVTLIASTIIGVLMGVFTHNSRRSGALAGFTVLAGLIGAIPEFLVAVLLVYFFAVRLHWFPVAGATSLKSFVLPALAITGTATALIARVVRAETDNVLGQDYIRVARSKRLPALLIYRRHALPNVMTAALTLAGVQLSSVVAATIVIEYVFNIPGLGTALVTAVTNRDFPVAQAIMLVFGAGALLVTWIVDLLIAAIDPRSNMQES
jgi:peptide/nickel transport system permease protein